MLTVTGNRIDCIYLKLWSPKTGNITENTLPSQTRCWPALPLDTRGHSLPAVSAPAHVFPVRQLPNGCSLNALRCCRIVAQVRQSHEAVWLSVYSLFLLLQPASMFNSGVIAVSIHGKSVYHLINISVYFWQRAKAISTFPLNYLSKNIQGAVQ